MKPDYSYCMAESLATHGRECSGLSADRGGDVQTIVRKGRKEMYLWNTAALVEDLKNNAVPEAEFKTYYVFSTVAILILFYLAGFAASESPNSIAELIEVMATIAVAIIGLNLAFKANLGNDGAGFLNKVASLSVPLMIKVTVLTFAIFIPFAALHYHGSIDETQYDWIGTVASILLDAFFYWRLIKHIRAVNS